MYLEVEPYQNTLGYCSIFPILNILQVLAITCQAETFCFFLLSFVIKGWHPLYTKSFFFSVLFLCLCMNSLFSFTFSFFLFQLVT